MLEVVKKGNKEYATDIPYSTSERRIGTWIDGKPLYRKVILVDNPTIGTGVQTIATTISGVNNITKIEGLMKSSGGFNIPFNSIWSNDINARNSLLWVDVTSNTANIKYTINSNWISITNLVIIVEYTKTTD